MDQFGDNLFNIYGSTEVAYATIANPADLREAPGTAGKPPFATVVKILDEDGTELPQGEAGRIFVGNSILFEGYTGGGSKDMVDGLMATGDVGRFDEGGRLIVEGRDDEMIVSRRRERLPQGGRGLPGAAREGVGGGRDRRGRRRLRQAAARLRGAEDGADVSEDDLKAYVKQNLARYKVPREIVFLDELPRNATGKVLKRELVDDGDGDENETARGGGR